MVRTLRLLALLLVVAFATFAVLGFTNARALGGGFYSGLDTLLKRATAVREAASPEYQREVLTSLPANPTTGPVLRLDDHMAEARIVDEPVRSDAYAGFENVFTYEFDKPGELVSAGGQLKPTVHDGVLTVEHVKGDYLRTLSPSISSPTTSARSSCEPRRPRARTSRSAGARKRNRRSPGAIASRFR